jgi:hypothetical protein
VLYARNLARIERSARHPPVHNPVDLVCVCTCHAYHIPCARCPCLLHIVNTLNLVLRRVAQRCTLATLSHRRHAPAVFLWCISTTACHAPHRALSTPRCGTAPRVELLDNLKCSTDCHHRLCAFAQVWYCSVECQKTHWKEGGHKKQCKALQAAARATVERGTPTAEKQNAVPPATLRSTVGGSDVGACTICLDSEPPPIQSGCACRGDAGLAHVECRAEAAAHRTAHASNRGGWWKCGTCGQDFTGAMQLGLAEALWSSAQRLPEENDDRLSAAMTLANALLAQGKYAKAVSMYRDVLVVQKRVLGPEHRNTLSTTTNLVNALNSQGKCAEAETMNRELLVVQKRVLGPNHPDTLTSTMNLATALRSQGKCAEAETMYREVLVVQQRVLGPEHPNTLSTANNLALALYSQDKFAEAETMFRELLVVQQRVLGPEHPNTLLSTMSLADALCSQDKYAEAETMYRELLVVQKRVQGPDHPIMLRTAECLAACTRAAHSTHNSW